MGRKIVNISVPPKLQAFIEYRVESGRYASVSEYFRDLLKRDEEWESGRMPDWKMQIADVLCRRVAGSNIPIPAAFEKAEATLT